MGTAASNRSSYTESVHSNNNTESHQAAAHLAWLHGCMFHAILYFCTLNTMPDICNAAQEPGRRKSQLLLTNIDVNKEKRTQKFLLLILVSHFLCILPINIAKSVNSTIISQNIYFPLWVIWG